jgi:tetratricopeptide (TPR) repeat protein
MTIIEKVYGNFVLTTMESPDTAINFFNENIVVFNNIERFETKEDLINFEHMFWFYSSALFERGRYNDTIDIVLKFLPIIEIGIEEFEIDKSSDKHYKRIIYEKARASYNLNDYNAAFNDFKELSSYEPNNDRYKNWLSSSNNGKQQRIINALCIFGTIGLITDVVGGKSIPKEPRVFIISISLIFLIIALVMQIIISRNKRRRKSNL